MSKGNIYIISGPSGSGKDTILKEVLKVKKDVFFSISHITRAMRTGEVEGEKYHFISREEFEQQLANNMFLEYNEYSGNYYGTPKAPIEQHLAAGDDVLIECDVNGAEALRKLLPGALSVFIMPPSFEVLKKRLIERKVKGGLSLEEATQFYLDSDCKNIEKVLYHSHQANMMLEIKENRFYIKEKNR